MFSPHDEVSSETSDFDLPMSPTKSQARLQSLLVSEQQLVKNKVISPKTKKVAQKSESVPNVDVVFSPHDAAESEASGDEDDPMIPSKKKSTKSLVFAKMILNENRRKKRLKDNFRYKYEMANVERSQKRVDSFKQQWIEEKLKFENEIKVDDDRLVEQMISQLEIHALDSQDISYLFDKFREIRQIMLSFRNLEVSKLFKILVGRKDIDQVVEVLKFIHNDAYGLQFVEEDDYQVSGISDEDKNTIMSNLDLDTDNEEECDRWVSYILFFTNPSVQWTSLRDRYARMYFRIIDTCLVQAMMNNDIESVNTLLQFEIPDILKSCVSDSNLSPIIRADRTFSSFKRNSCIVGCQGHRGKLLLLMIRMRNNVMANRCILEGISAASKCCTGHAVRIYWDNAKSKSGEDGEDDILESDTKKGGTRNDFLRILGDEKDEEEDLDFDFTGKEEELAKKKKKQKRKIKITLRSEYEYETPLSTAVRVSNIDAFNRLLPKCSPLLCNDIAIRVAMTCIRLKPKVTEMGVIKVKDDSVYIFEQVCAKALELRQKSFKQNTKPFYCLVALMYQAIVEQENVVLDKLLLLLADGNEDESSFLTKAILVDDFDFALGKAKKAKKKFGLFGGNNKKKENLTAANMCSKDVSEELAYVLLTVIDLLLEDMFDAEKASHERALNGIITLIEKYNIYLDNFRFERLLMATTKVLESDKPGDQEQVIKLFENRQFLHFLGFKSNSSESGGTSEWTTRSIDLFVLRQDLSKMLGLSADDKHRTGYDQGESRGTLLENVFLQSARLDIPGLVYLMITNAVKLDNEVVENAVVLAAKESNFKTIQVLVQSFGKRLLQQAFTVAVSNSSIDTIREVLRLDNLLVNDAYSLTESFLKRLLLKTKMPDTIKKKKNKLKSGSTASGDLVLDQHSPFLLDFIYIFSEMPPERTRLVFKDAFRERKQLNFDVASEMVKKADKYSKSSSPQETFASKEFIDFLLEIHPSQFESKSDDVQTGWLKFVLDVFKIAAKGNRKLAEDYNDKIVRLLELKPEFDAVIDYASEEGTKSEGEML